MAELNCYITEQRIEGADDGVLDGKTVAVKDNISTVGVETTCGSKMLEGYVPPYDATVVERLKDAGATIAGKANMDEFGMGTTTETSYYGATLNPVDTGRVPGGSSGGSAAAVAAGEADLALGTDTGGSIRAPAAFCGVVGIKPTYGLVSRYGLIAYANSLEQIGPIAATVEEAAGLLDVLAGPDERDATTVEEGADSDYAAAADGDVAGMTIGVPVELVEGADEGVVETFWNAIAKLEDQGAEYVEVSMPSVEKAVAAYYVIAMSEASSNLARFDGTRYGLNATDVEGAGDLSAEGNWNEAFAKAREDGFGPEVKRRILLGTFALSAGYHDRYYGKAQDARAWIRQDFDDSLDEADVLASPTMPVPPFELGEGLKDPRTMYLADANTVPINLADVPAISVPAGESDGLPVGMQLIGPKYGEERIIRAASALE
ncbi:MAG: Asp-tRNA(Asn)/Glu-tRNA(Gln) amidotransferase subunit GatA [Halolamina sp.]|uniref:Asp-tRNA(Asn)/Glu-tRNA(Gln) amidotransferase subunit GatA n=1 Tax=Halolamina sp. TaxID=1940283 RepID=UPI002FC3AEC5